MKSKNKSTWWSKYNILTITMFPILLMIWPLTKIAKVKNDFMPLLKLINKLFINSPVNLFLAFFYPMIFIGILPHVASAQYMVMGIASLIPIIVGVQVMPGIIISLKRSTILKRIGATNIKTNDITLVLITYFSLVAISSTFFNLSIGIAMYADKMHLDLIDYGQTILSMLIGIMIGISIGIFISSIVKDSQLSLLIGLLLTLPGAFLSSEFLPPSMINGWGPVRYISFIFPQKIATTFIHVVSNDGNMFAFEDVKAIDYDSISQLNDLEGKLPSSAQSAFTNFKNYIKPLEVVSKEEIIISWILTPIEVALFTTLSIKYFKWGVRW